METMIFNYKIPLNQFRNIKTLKQGSLWNCRRLKLLKFYVASLPCGVMLTLDFKGNSKHWRKHLLLSTFFDFHELKIKLQPSLPPPPKKKKKNIDCFLSTLCSVSYDNCRESFKVQLKSFGLGHCLCVFEET